MSDRLFHFTCKDHGLPGISRSGVVIPNWHPYLQVSAAWFTTEPHPNREASGLGMNLTKCDRMAYRFIVDRDACQQWERSWVRKRADWHVVRDLEQFGDPEHWWIATTPVAATIDLTYKPGGIGAAVAGPFTLTPEQAREFEAQLRAIQENERGADRALAALPQEQTGEVR